VISTFSSPLPVRLEKTELDAIFDGGVAGSGDAVAIAVCLTEGGWFSSPETRFLVVLDSGKVGWVKSGYCKFPELIKQSAP
jgi:hypothetical protein